MTHLRRAIKAALIEDLGQPQTDIQRFMEHVVNAPCRTARMARAERCQLSLLDVAYLMEIEVAFRVKPSGEL